MCICVAHEHVRACACHAFASLIVPTASGPAGLLLPLNPLSLLVKVVECTGI